MPFQTLIQQLKGGAGSGNFGHSGRPGKRGGSAPYGSGSKLVQLGSDHNELLDEAKIVFGDANVVDYEN